MPASLMFTATATAWTARAAAACWTARSAAAKASDPGLLAIRRVQAETNPRLEPKPALKPA
eukprot:486760-Alexandrium_andersonii.AAC.1